MTKFRCLILLLPILAPCHALFSNFLSASGLRSFNDGFKDFLEIRARDLMRHGNETMGIPVLDPLQVDRYDLDVRNDNITLNCILTNLVVHSLSDYDVVMTDFNAWLGFRVTLELKWPVVTLKTNYNLEGAVFGTPVFGSGEVMMALSDLDTTVVAYLNWGEPISVRDLTVDVSLGQLIFSGTGMMNNDTLSQNLSSVVSRDAPRLLRDYQEEITPVISGILRDKLNERLSNFTVSTLMALIV